MQTCTKPTNERSRESRSAAAAAKQQEFFRQARAILKPSEVRLNHVPNWFRLRMLKTFHGCTARCVHKEAGNQLAPFTKLVLVSGLDNSDFAVRTR